MNKKILTKSLLLTLPMVSLPFVVISCSNNNNNTNLPGYAIEAINLIEEKDPKKLVNISIKEVPANELIQNIDEYIAIEFNDEIKKLNNKIQNEIQKDESKKAFEIKKKVSIRIPNLSKETKEIDKIEVKVILTTWNVESKVGTFNIDISKIDRKVNETLISKLPNKENIMEKIRDITSKLDKKTLDKSNIDRQLSYGSKGIEYNNLFIKWDEKDADIDNNISIYCYFSNDKIDDISTIKEQSLYFIEKFTIGNKL